MAEHSRCCGAGAGGTGRTALRTRPGEPVIPLNGPVSQSIIERAGHVSSRVHADLVERHAQELHSRSSFDCWNGLSDRDQELWRHMARMDLGVGQ
jgi:hypothetical protein